MDVLNPKRYFNCKICFLRILCLMVLGLNTNDFILKNNLSLLCDIYILKYFKNFGIYFLMFPSPQTTSHPSRHAWCPIIQLLIPGELPFSSKVKLQIVSQLA